MAAKAAAIAAECRLAGAAHAATARALGQAPNSIGIGCPGRKGLADGATRKQDRQRFAAAAWTPLPEAAKPYGRTGKLIFQRMIARGVPPEIATKLAGTRDFEAAVAAAQAAN
jgi:hypothetical protein